MRAVAGDAIPELKIPLKFSTTPTFVPKPIIPNSNQPCSPQTIEENSLPSIYFYSINEFLYFK
jgi:hypothetical protein